MALKELNKAITAVKIANSPTSCSDICQPNWRCSTYAVSHDITNPAMLKHPSVKINTEVFFAALKRKLINKAAAASPIPDPNPTVSNIADKTVRLSDIEIASNATPIIPYTEINKVLRLILPKTSIAATAPKKFPTVNQPNISVIDVIGNPK